MWKHQNEGILPLRKTKLLLISPCPMHKRVHVCCYSALDSLIGRISRITTHYKEKEIL